MSKSNPMHHRETEIPDEPVWPFPAELLDYPSLPPLSRPVKEKVELPTEEPPF